MSKFRKSQQIPKNTKSRDATHATHLKRRVTGNTLAKALKMAASASVNIARGVVALVISLMQLKRGRNGASHKQEATDAVQGWSRQGFKISTSRGASKTTAMPKKRDTQ